MLIVSLSFNRVSIPRSGVHLKTNKENTIYVNPQKGYMESAEALESSGNYLKATRESQGLSLNEVAQATRIREAVLRALEEGKYEDLPHLYVKGFLRAYAGYLGLDPNEVILHQQKYIKNLPPSNGKVQRQHPVPRKRRVDVKLLVIFISVLFLIALLVYASYKLLPQVFPPLRVDESSPYSSSSGPSMETSA